MPKEMRLTLPPATVVPNHIAIIPDGNRRWARARGLPTLQGHKKGFDRAVELARCARDFGVHTVTLWGFSTENWDRTSAEINYLMKLYSRLVDEFLAEADEDDVKIVHIGRKDRLPSFLLKKITYAEEKTYNNHSYIANLAIDYGGHDDILRAIKKIVKDKIAPSNIDKKLIEDYLDTKNQPYPYVDLLIRTSGEQRTSGLLLWQMEYAETYWEPDHFPDFTPEKLRDAILDYSRRRRRFGGNDAIQHLRFKPQVTAKFEVAWWRLQNIPQGTRFSEYAMSHIKEQFGLSKVLAREASRFMIEAIRDGNSKKWKQAARTFKMFYQLVKDELKLAFEPAIVASLEVKILQKMQEKDDKISAAEVEELSRMLVAEVYRISEFQARKAGHLRALANLERNRAKNGQGEEHWQLAKEYLEKYYMALKDRVA
jgi:undecaprenyl diphosphate synthase